MGCGVLVVVSMRREYSHSSMGLPGLSGSMSKSKNESAASCDWWLRSGCRLVTCSSGCVSHVPSAASLSDVPLLPSPSEF